MSALTRLTLSRREFLQKVGAGVTIGVAANLLAGRIRPGQASEEPTPDTWAMLIDLTRCTGCNACALACKESNDLPDTDIAPQALDSDTYTFVEARQGTTADGEVQTRYVKRQCMHCLKPACVSACPAAAMYRGAGGAVIYRPNRCLGCRYCQIACPFGVPRFDWDNGINPAISKCWLCYDRLQAGQRPACVDGCPTGALRFGRREELLAQAHAQIASNPDRYLDHIFGEFEVGGTSILYLSDVPFAELGFPVDLPHTAPSDETEKIMAALPPVIAGVTILMAGAAAYTHRRPAKARPQSAAASEGRSPLPSDGSEE
jgi:formate dehydrogenase iron-sulfur subunit